jgi:hypothetical protein
VEGLGAVARATGRVHTACCCGQGGRCEAASLQLLAVHESSTVACNCFQLIIHWNVHRVPSCHHHLLHFLIFSPTDRRRVSPVTSCDGSLLAYGQKAPSRLKCQKCTSYDHESSLCLNELGIYGLDDPPVRGKRTCRWVGGTFGDESPTLVNRVYMG